MAPRFLPSLAIESKKAGGKPSGLAWGRRWGGVGQPYKGNWDTERAVQYGMQMTVWVFRAVDAIASNAAHLPFVIRADDPVKGVIKDVPEITNLMNRRPNKFQDSWSFRYALSSQILLSKRGAFVEVQRSRRGDPIALFLLQPDSVSPIPDPKTYVSGFEVQIGQNTKILAPEDVIWIKLPHPTDPYQGLTPLEAAGLAIEVDLLAKQFNRNFLQNDGRPGGILAIKGGIEDEDAEVLRQRFLGTAAMGNGPAGAGRLTILETGEDGDVEFVDTATTPRDAQYVEMRKTTKQEILLAFGVSEALIGDASGRCLRQTEFVRLANGERHMAKDLVGKHFTLLTSTPNGQIEVEASASFEAVEPIYRVTTESGRTIEANSKHPLFAASYTKAKDAGWRTGNGPRIDELGWTAIKDLEPKMLVAVPSQFDQRSEGGLTETEATLVGYLLGDGSMSAVGGSVALTTPDSPMVKDFIRCVEALGNGAVNEYETADRVAAWGTRAVSRKGAHGGRDTNPARALVRRLGLLGTTAHTKFIPSEVFASSKSAQRLCVGALIATDGCVYVGESTPTPSHPRPTKIATVSYSTVHHRLALDIQELLMRLGIASRLDFKKDRKGGLPGMEGKLYSSWTVMVDGADAVRFLLSQITVVGKEPQSDKALEIAEEKCRPKASGGNIHKWRFKQLDPGLRWERIKKIEEIGVDQTVGIAVPGHHTYLGTFYEHNTFDNADVEQELFWRSTMLPHLQLIARPMDALTSDPNDFAGFDISSIYVLGRDKREEDNFLLNEVRAGVLSVDGYLERTGQEKIGDNRRYISSKLIAYNPDGSVAHDPTAKPLPPKLPKKPGGTDTTPDGLIPLDPSTNNPTRDDTLEDPSGPTPPKIIETIELEVKGVDTEERSVPTWGPWVVDTGELTSRKANLDRRLKAWERTAERQMKTFFTRQERVVLEKLMGRKARDKWAIGEPVQLSEIFDKVRWDEQLTADAGDWISQVMADFGSEVAEAFQADWNEEAASELIESQKTRILKVNEDTARILTTILLSTQGNEIEAAEQGVKVAFEEAITNRSSAIADTEVVAAANRGILAAAVLFGSDDMTKTWTTLSGAASCGQKGHIELDGVTVPLGERFDTESFSLDHPSDPGEGKANTQTCGCLITIGNPTELVGISGSLGLT